MNTRKFFIGRTIGFIVILFLGLLWYVLSSTLFSRPSTDTLSADDAISAVIKMHPELAAYKTTSLPPSSIETKQTTEGWYVGFIQSGSGVPGVLNAMCYHVISKENAVLTGTYERQDGQPTESIALETCAPIIEQPTSSSTPGIIPHLPTFGTTTLGLNQLAAFQDMSIRPLSIEEDSRCPNDVQCIQAGTVRVKVWISTATGSSTSILKLGQAFTTEGKAITLVGVKPDKNSKLAITNADYRLVFNVAPQGSVENPNPQGKCYIGGCSSQLCTDQPDAVSTCEYTAQYACYKSASCQRQSNGQCGWTQTAELKACLMNP